MLAYANASSQSWTSPRQAPPAAAMPFAGTAHLTGSPMPFARNEEVYGEGEPAEFIYQVISGAVRTYKMLNDGRRQICAFHLAGDVFGLEGGEEHSFSAEAVNQSTLLVIKRSAVTALAAKDPALSRKLWNLTADELQKMQDHVMLLIKTAQERVASFLLQMAQRMPAATEIELPMSRQDIADYLGLTIETVSRTLTQLETRATIALPSSRRIVLRNRGLLHSLNA
jgi:cAMP-binding proteins - catabolite gene activator and regulatory subunit of cAMP-dependent protein kinases